MTRWLRACFLTVAAICAASALVLVLLRSFRKPRDDFNAVGSPAEPWALDLHVVSAVALTLTLGVVFGMHVAPRWAAETRARASGTLLIVLAALTIASGALLPCTANEAVRAAVSWTHGVSGATFALAVPWHLLLVRAAKRRADARANSRADQGNGSLRRAPTPRSSTSAAACQELARR